LFPVSSDDQDDSGYALSPMAYGYVAGVLDHAPALMSILNPTVNSYKRTGATSTMSGATWAPRFATYGGDNRSCMVRIPDNKRVEVRVGDGAACSYLSMAAVLGAGLEGIRNSAHPGLAGPEHTEGREPMPRTLIEAVHAFEDDHIVRGVLDAVDPTAGVSAYYAKLKRDEFYSWHSQVSEWEIERYLTA
jgi:glutamine synthetase